jgi:hypothetical protein
MRRKNTTVFQGHSIVERKNIFESRKNGIGFDNFPLYWIGRKSVHQT